MYKARLHWKPIAALMLLAIIWGMNMAIIKIASQEIAPLFMAGLRSMVAAACLCIWMKTKRIVLFPSKIVVIHGIAVGLLFGFEFGLIYQGLEYTLTSRVYVLLYTAPFFAALEAHFWLDKDRLNLAKAIGLLLAFGGIVTLFARNFGTFSFATLPGDLMILAAGALWASTTVYIKKYLAFRTLALQTLFYQVLFSAPLLFFLSICFENRIISGFSLITGFSLFYQCIIVAFLSYIIWFGLIHRYQASLLHAFTFFTPILGVFLSGLLIMGEKIAPELIAALIFVSFGIVLVNYQPAVAPANTSAS